MAELRWLASAVSRGPRGSKYGSISSTISVKRLTTGRQRRMLMVAADLGFMRILCIRFALVMGRECSMKIPVALKTII
jgi:hypothetical protein